MLLAVRFASATDFMSKKEHYILDENLGMKSILLTIQYLMSMGRILTTLNRGVQVQLSWCHSIYLVISKTFHKQLSSAK